MTTEEAKELLPFYAVDALDADEAAALDALLRDASAEVQKELRDWQEVAAMLPLAVREVSPSAHLRSQLFDRISVPEHFDLPELAAEPFMEPFSLEVAERTMTETLVAETPAKVLPFTAPRQRFGAETQRWMLLAASLLLALSSIYLYRRNSQLDAERLTLVAKLDTANIENANLVTSLNNYTRILSMTGVETPEANAKVIWDTRDQAWKVFVFKLPAPPSDKDYQLWFVTKTQKISAKVFSTDSRGQSMLSFIVPPEALKGLAATAVTLEPKGGSPQPTGKFYLKAAI